MSVIHEMKNRKRDQRDRLDEIYVRISNRLKRDGESTMKFEQEPLRLLSWSSCMAAQSSVGSQLHCGRTGVNIRITISRSHIILFCCLKMSNSTISTEML